MTHTIALTGATGFVGRFLARALVQQGWNVRALMRDPKRKTAIANLPIEWIQGDLADPIALQQLVQGTHAVVHCAGAIRGITLDDFYRVNVAGVEQLLKACLAQSSVPRFCLISSVAAREPMISAYAKSKRQGEEVLLRHKDQLDWVILRPPAIYGPEDEALLPLIKLMRHGIAPIATSPGARLSLIYVEDVVSAVVRWLQLPTCPAAVYEIDDGHANGYSWDEIVMTMQTLRKGKIYKINLPKPLLELLAKLNVNWAKLRGRLPVFTLDKVKELYHPNWICDNTAWSRASGWQPQVTLLQGLERSITR